MANPRDFLPAKYKKADQSDMAAVAEPKVADTIPSQTSDSLWSGLASDDDLKATSSGVIPSDSFTPPSSELLSNQSIASTQEVDDKDGSTAENLDSVASSTPTSAQSIRPKSKQNKLAGLLVVLFLVIGTAVGYLLMLQNQDGRQQASGGSAPPYSPDANGNCSMAGYVSFTVQSTGQQVCLKPSLQGGAGEPPKVCGAGMTLVNNNQTNQAACVLTSLLGYSAGSPNAPSAEPVLCNGERTGQNAQGCAGWCWDSTQGQDGIIVSGGSACVPDWNDCNQVIAGTYTWVTPGETECKRYMINSPDTANALVQYMVNNPLIAAQAATSNVFYQNSTDENGNQLPLEIVPFLHCSDTATGVMNQTENYNLVPSDQCHEGSDYCSFTIGDRCYINDKTYDALIALGQTWSPYNTGCGDGVHDYQEGQPGGSTGGYQGDCNTWHFTTCLNPGTGVNGLGCDITTTNPPNEPPNEPPSEPPTTTTPPPTGTPTPTPTLPPQLVCTDIEMLDASGSAMTGDDDQNLVDGDRVRFRSSASAEDPDATFEFRILPPNTYAWIDITDTSATAAPDVSAFYTIVSSGHHVVQSRLCIDGVCQVWESNDENNVSDNLFISRGATCQAPPGVTSDRMLRTCEQRSDCPTDHYCGTDIVCETNADCSNGFVCYQPPMPACPSGMSCTQQMPDKICADVDPALITNTSR